MKKTMKKALGLFLTATLVTSSAMWVSGQTATTKNTNLKCMNGICTVNGAMFNDAKNSSAKIITIQKDAKSNPVKAKTEAATVIHNDFTFTGKGSWSDPANWENSKVPPATLKDGDRIIIDGSGPCMYNSMAFFNATNGSSIEIKPGKQLYVSNGNAFRFKGGTLSNNGTLSVLSGTFETPEKEAATNESFGKITTTRFSQVKSVEQEKMNEASLEKRPDDKKTSKISELIKMNPALIKTISKQ